jgi:hypothetical protein
MLEELPRGAIIELSLFPEDFEERSRAKLLQSTDPGTRAWLQYELGCFKALQGKDPHGAISLLDEALQNAKAAGNLHLAADISRAYVQCQWALKSMGLAKLGQPVLSGFPWMKAFDLMYAFVSDGDTVGDVLAVTEILRIGLSQLCFMVGYDPHDSQGRIASTYRALAGYVHDVRRETLEGTEPEARCAFEAVAVGLEAFGTFLKLSGIKLERR